MNGREDPSAPFYVSLSKKKAARGYTAGAIAAKAAPRFLYPKKKGGESIRNQEI